ncbi:MAG TPA: transglutaminase-like domain-containing protein [Planctomycetota bacterium]|nr:transglutaminase-like domain-containing protein [Planctomycetota bacterium]HQA99827.1 transglutaminase-like domain-containing protein [Planctomycetota bacterium]
MDKVIVFFFLCLFSYVHAKEIFWYNYLVQGNSSGYAKISYDKIASQYHKQQQKTVATQNGLQTETLSAVLNEMYSLESAYIKNNPQDYLVITVGEKIIFQKQQSIQTYPQDICYLDINDFLKSLVATKQTEYGKFYFGKVLASTQDKFISARARYMGETEVPVCFQIISSHIFKVTTEELNNFWANAHVDKKGNLLGYSLGTFQMIISPSLYVKSIENKIAPMQTTYIFNNDNIKKMYLQCADDLSTTLPSTPFQKIKANNIMLLSPKKNTTKSVALSSLIKESAYLAPQTYIPTKHSYITKLAKNICNKETNAQYILKRILHWTKNNLGEKQTKKGQEFANFLGAPPDVASVATVALCKASGIPARLTAGLYYELGYWKPITWAEVYLQTWQIIHQHKIKNGACFLTLKKNMHYHWTTPLPTLQPQITHFWQNNQKIQINKPDTYITIQQEYVSDKLLGICFNRPADWVVLPKNATSDLLVLRSIQGKGPAILLKTFQLPQSLEELLLSVGQKIGMGTSTELLWKQNRKFKGGTAFEIALKTIKNNTIYRVFLGECQQRGILALLIVPQNELLSVEKGFQTLINSLELE